MRIISFIVALLLTLVLIFVLDRPLGTAPPLGSFVSPQQGFWQNAEPLNKKFSVDLDVTSLKGPVSVYFDDRMVPHVFASNDNDAYFAEGYLHARFRLWQMEFQTHAAAGRLSEVLGAGPDSAYLNNDRIMRRVGMVYGARRSLEEMEKDPDTRAAMDAYTAGVNAYLSALTQADLPLEYRLLHYRPEKWTNLKTALFLKYMSYDLTGAEDDIERTNAKSFFSREDFNKLYPAFPDSLDPIVPKGTYFGSASVNVSTPATADSEYFNWKEPVNVFRAKPDRDNGSNNWAIAGSKTKSGRPILCNDPHLGLNLPSLWYEMQISTPTHNVYGVSFPGAPAIVIGFNDSIAWGMTNAARDVRDYYRIRFKDDSHAQYWFENAWKDADLQIEQFLQKDGTVFYDTVAYTVFGPVMYDDNFDGHGRARGNIDLAVRWRAHDPSNELNTFLLLNKAANYSDYRAAISHFVCPGQNFVFAAKSGQIALWQQGLFPAEWPGQGSFIMPGTDSAYRWQQNIPQEENPHLVDPERGFVSSANQLPADSTYPYFLGGGYDLYRGLMINRYLTSMAGATTADMQKMQIDNYNLFAQTAMPVLLAHLNTIGLNNDEVKYLDIVRNWNMRNDNEEAGPTIFTRWYETFENLVWKDELAKQPPPYTMPEPYTLFEALLRDTAFSFVDNVNTPVRETLSDQVTAAFRQIVPELREAEANGRLRWSAFKDAGIRHLLRIPALSRFHLNTGGGLNVINATKQFHGPSWRMVVQLSDKTEAYGVYPGGQSGNAGSPYYDQFVDTWASGRYYPLWVMNKAEGEDPRIRFAMHFNKQ